MFFSFDVLSMNSSVIRRFLKNLKLVPDKVDFQFRPTLRSKIFSQEPVWIFFFDLSRFRVFIRSMKIPFVWKTWNCILIEDADDARDNDDNDDDVDIDTDDNDNDDDIDTDDNDTDDNDTDDYDNDCDVVNFGVCLGN